nr:YidC/Oxa1 family membrane protein insertase [Streptococcus ovuberis]
MLAVGLMVLTACGTGPITSETTDFWDKFVYFFAQAIRFLGVGGNIGIGIILFTLIIRTLLLPLSKVQMASSRKMQDLQPKVKELRERYPGRDNQLLLTEEIQRLYKEEGVNQMASMLPLFVQMPILIALFQALSRVDFLKTGQFLWLNLSQTDPYYILPILAAVFTFLSSWLMSKAQLEKSGMMTAMTYLMTAMIFWFALRSSSGVALYWTVSNAYQVFQTLLFNNPFKIIAEREAERLAEKQRMVRIRKAQKKAKKRK